jgi:hypothetical protein
MDLDQPGGVFAQMTSANLLPAIQSRQLSLGNKILEHYWDEIHAVPELSKGPDRSKVAKLLRLQRCANKPLSLAN